MTNRPKDEELNEAFTRMQEKVSQQVAEHKAEDIDLEDLEDVSGGWRITYETDPDEPIDPSEA